MSYRVIQITDCHLFADNTKMVGEGIVSYQTLARVLQRMVSCVPDLVMVTGDLSADETARSYEHFISLWNKYAKDSKLLVIPGNHDNPEFMFNAMPNAFWKEQVISIPGWDLHALHSQVEGEGRGHVSRLQLENLQRNVNQSNASSHLVAVHHHPIAMNSWMDNYDWKNRREFVAFVERNEAISLVLHGHVHKARDIELGGARLLAAPSTCWQFKHTAEFAFDQGEPGFRIIDLHKDGSFDTEVVYLDNEDIEH